MSTVTGNWAVHGTATTGITTIELMESSEVVTVINRSTTELYFNLASSGVSPTSSPAVTGVDSFVVPGVAGASTTVEAGQQPITVELTCSGTAAFSVIGGQAPRER